MYDDSRLYYILRTDWVDGRPVWTKIIITAEEARHLYNQRLTIQKEQYANLLRA